MRRERIMVTGAGGFLGSHICHYFGQRGHAIAAVGRFSNSPGAESYYPNLWKFCGMTLPDEQFFKVLDSFKPTILIHCAGTASVAPSVLDPYGDFKKTVDVCAFTLEALRTKAPDCKFILLSSASVYGNPVNLPIGEDTPSLPISPYGHHKRMCEILVEEYRDVYNISSAILRIFSAFGERLRKQVIYDLCKKLVDETNDVLEAYGTGKESRDFIHASDVAQAIDVLINTGAEGYFNAASGIQTSIEQLVNIIAKAIGSSKTVDFTGQTRQGDPLFWQADISKLKTLGYTPKVSIEEGIENYCRWFIEHERGSYANRS